MLFRNLRNSKVYISFLKNKDIYIKISTLKTSTIYSSKLKPVFYLHFYRFDRFPVFRFSKKSIMNLILTVSCKEPDIRMKKPYQRISPSAICMQSAQGYFDARIQQTEYFRPFPENLSSRTGRAAEGQRPSPLP